MRVYEAINHALQSSMEENDKIILIGEDILDPYGGAFKVTKGLSSKFEERVIDTPISEQAIIGIGTGLSLQGFVPIIEIMFGDFLTLITDQIVNHVSKIRMMYGKEIPLPLIIRTPMGGRRGYGPTHSQSLEKLFFGIPGVIVVAVSSLFNPGDLLEKCIKSNSPTIFIENKVLYAKPVKVRLEEYATNIAYSKSGIPTLTLTSGIPDLTIITYGGMVEITLSAAKQLLEEEGLRAEIIIPHQLSPLYEAPILDSATKTKRAVIVEEGHAQWGWGSEVASMLTDIQMEAPVQRVGSKLAPIPACRSLEDQFLPNERSIIDAAIRTVDRSYILNK
ncbi:transketolase C-terminal domain-containing protein [Maridesulfovibrio sp.]|uniref:alpha-ketoacid dehydrogenase subunit beta n=1 Tax=Maridesulfovibrio sp. TaxID=2795000 RepID=UPI002A189F9A|nr:transketolase C-terminal domain-containing protein [Maridesulfovibrio sp.]